jgi:hypothetical protein
MTIADQTDSRLREDGRGRTTRGRTTIGPSYYHA